MNRAKLTSLLLILCMAGSGAAAELSSFTAYAAEEETVITEDVNEEEETVEEAPAEEPEDEAVVEEPAEDPAREVDPATYERALVLDPAHSDARYNVDFVRTRAGIDEDQGANIFGIWIDAAVGRLSSNAWAIIALVAFLLMLAAVAAYIFLDAIAWRKVGFFGAIIALVITIGAMVCAVQMRDRASSHRQAIVMAQPATLSTSPRTPKDKSEVAFELAAGFKVTIIDKVTTAGTVWYHIETASRRQAWINAQNVELI